jgi:hypothetical protein
MGIILSRTLANKIVSNLSTVPSLPQILVKGIYLVIPGQRVRYGS